MQSQGVGIYGIECRANGKLYVGSSKRMRVRWTEHRKLLKYGRHTSPYLQHAWNFHGAEAFRFFVIEECVVDQLEAREQHHLDTLRPAFNSVIDIRRLTLSPEMEAKRVAAVRAYAASITHCPHGHEYTDTNSYRTTYKNKDGTRICRECNRLRVAAIYAAETPAQYEARRLGWKDRYQRNRERLIAQMKARAASRKSEKREYDRQRRERLRVPIQAVMIR